MTAEQANSLYSAEEETQRAIRRMQAAGLQGEEARRAAPWTWRSAAPWTGPDKHHEAKGRRRWGFDKWRTPWSIFAPANPAA